MVGLNVKEVVFAFLSFHFLFFFFTVHHLHSRVGTSCAHSTQRSTGRSSLTAVQRWEDKLIFLDYFALQRNYWAAEHDPDFPLPSHPPPFKGRILIHSHSSHSYSLLPSLLPCSLITYPDWKDNSCSSPSQFHKHLSDGEDRQGWGACEGPLRQNCGALEVHVLRQVGQAGWAGPAGRQPSPSPRVLVPHPKSC